MRGAKILDGIEYENFSLDDKVGFIEDTHKYVLLEDEDFEFNSVTTIIKEYENEFDSLVMSEKCSKNKKHEHYGKSPEEIRRLWKEKGTAASNIGTDLHNYGEFVLNGYPEDFKDSIKIPDSVKTPLVEEAVEDLWDKGYELAVTELLVYDVDLKLAGQSDIILKKKNGKNDRITFKPLYNYMIYDWKFLNKPIQKKSYYNFKTRKYKMMKGIFKHLQDCNWIHYSIQLAIYQVMSGMPEDITEKVLVVVTEDGYEFVPCFPMHIYWDSDSNIQVIHELPNGKWYMSETNSTVKIKPNIEYL